MIKSIELVVCVIVLISLVDYSLAIECYTCSTKRNPEACLRPEKNHIPRKRCNKSSLNDTYILAKEIDNGFSDIFEVELSALDPMVSTTCLKQITRVGEKKIILRGCQLVSLPGNLNVCNKVKKHERNNMRTTFCELCNNRDGCNSSTKAEAGLKWIILNIFIVTSIYRIEEYRKTFF
ncbi:hypothetical protein WA026_001508 [Henosepilachna vigintioctopunctata]|uniref:Protein sleepless n=1 Tax=Henosepilachna vigintioctopunctata TaxID=420089 RepID=A0AAW1UIB6_9CUCU